MKRLQKLDAIKSDVIEQRVASRLKTLRTEGGFSQQRVADALQVRQNTYSQYENGRRQLPLEALARLAVFYDVSADYILGLTEVEFPYPKN